jgi:hypothetical protein
VPIEPRFFEVLGGAIRRFRFRDVSLEEWMALDPRDRMELAGGVAVFYTARHPREAYELLRQFKPKS